MRASVLIKTINWTQVFLIPLFFKVGLNKSELLFVSPFPSSPFYLDTINQNRNDILKPMWTTNSLYAYFINVSESYLNFWWIQIFDAFKNPRPRSLRRAKVFSVVAHTSSFKLLTKSGCRIFISGSDKRSRKTTACSDLWIKFQIGHWKYYFTLQMKQMQMCLWLIEN